MLGRKSLSLGPNSEDYSSASRKPRPALEETIVVFNEPEHKTAVLGNSGITQPTKEQAMLNTATQLEAFLERKEAA